MDKRASIISVITNPLGFFALSLLIIEGYLTIVLVTPNDLPVWAKIYGMFIAVDAFFVIILIVTLLVWIKPLNLTLGGSDWNEFYGNNNNPMAKSEIERLPGAVVNITTVNGNASNVETKPVKRRKK